MHKRIHAPTHIRHTLHETSDMELETKEVRRVRTQIMYSIPVIVKMHFAEHYFVSK